MGDVGEAKRAAARAAVEFVEAGSVLGVGTGSTVECFIDVLSAARPRAAVATSTDTEHRLQEAGIPVVGLGAEPLSLYVDGADEVDRELRLIKGGGGALAREKVVATASRLFVCVADATKRVERLGTGIPVPVEILPMARRFVARELEKMGGRPIPRAGFVTDNGHEILDVEGLDLSAAAELESALNDVPGVVANGLFAMRGADVLLLGDGEDVSELRASGETLT